MRMERKYPQRLVISLHLVVYNPKTKKDKYLAGETITLYNVPRNSLKDFTRWIKKLITEKV